MNGYQVPEFIKKGEYYIRSEEEELAYREAYCKSLFDKDKAIKLLTILMANDVQPLTGDEILARVRAWNKKRDESGRPFYFYWGGGSFREFLDDLSDDDSDDLSKWGVYGYLIRRQDGDTVKYRVSKFGLKILKAHQKWLEEYLGETIEQIRQTFPPLPTK